MAALRLHKGPEELRPALLAFRRHLEDRSVSPRTALSYTGAVRAFVEWQGTDRQVTPARLRAYRQHLEAGGISAGKLRLVKAALSYFVLWLAKLTQGPALDVAPIFAPETDRRMKPGLWSDYRQERAAA